MNMFTCVYIYIHINGWIKIPTARLGCLWDVNSQEHQGFDSLPYVHTAIDMYV